MKRIGKILLTFIAVVITAGYLWFIGRPVIPKEANWEDVEGEAKRGGYRLIGTEKLWERYNRGLGDLLLVDTRQAWEYRTGHIKGALNFPMEPTWLSRWQKRRDLKKFLGSDKNRFIVFY